MTKGKGILVSGGVFNDADLRAPRDVANLYVSLACAYTRGDQSDSLSFKDHYAGSRARCCTRCINQGSAIVDFTSA